MPAFSGNFSTKIFKYVENTDTILFTPYGTASTASVFATDL